MEAAARIEAPAAPAPKAAREYSALERVIIEIAGSERALDEQLNRERRLHRARIEHEAASCLVCFLGE